VLPLLIALVKLRKSLAPVAVAIAFSVALPWCIRVRLQRYDYGNYHSSYTYSTPNLLAHALVAAFTVFIIWWGVRQASKALVNLGIVGFAIRWVFYFSDLFDKMGRALGLIGLGILFWPVDGRLKDAARADCRNGARSCCGPSPREGGGGMKLERRRCLELRWRWW